MFQRRLLDIHNIYKASERYSYNLQKYFRLQWHTKDVLKTFCVFTCSFYFESLTPVSGGSIVFVKPLHWKSRDKETNQSKYTARAFTITQISIIIIINQKKRIWVNIYMHWTRFYTEFLFIILVDHLDRVFLKRNFMLLSFSFSLLLVFIYCILL